jgi:hypothetical protein
VSRRQGCHSRSRSVFIRLALIRLRARGTEDSELRRSNPDCRSAKECAPSKITLFEHGLSLGGVVRSLVGAHGGSAWRDRSTADRMVGNCITHAW